MSASPKFYKPAAAAPAFSLRPELGGEELEYYYYDCRTPTGAGISCLREPNTCPPAPKKPSCCRKRRLFKVDVPEPTLLSLRLDELERLFRLQPSSQCDKRRRSARQQRKLDTTQLEA